MQLLYFMHEVGRMRLDLLDGLTFEKRNYLSIIVGNV